MMAGYHRQDLLEEVERDRLAREHQGSRSGAPADQGHEESSLTVWCYVLAHRVRVGVATAGIGGLIGLGLFFSLY
jgi:hypothetical protein